MGYVGINTYTKSVFQENWYYGKNIEATVQPKDA